MVDSVSGGRPQTPVEAFQNNKKQIRQIKSIK